MLRKTTRRIIDQWVLSQPFEATFTRETVVDALARHSSAPSRGQVSMYFCWCPLVEPCGTLNGINLWRRKRKDGQDKV